MSQTSQYPADDGIVGPYPRKDGVCKWWGVRIKGFEKFGLHTKAAAIYKRDQYRRDKYELKESPERYHAKRAKKVTIADLLQLVVDDFRRNKYVVADALGMQKFWTEYKGKVTASKVTGSMMLMWADEMLEDGLSNSTVNKKMDKLLRGYNIAMGQEPPLVTSKPKWKDLKEADPRSGFVQWPQFVQLRAALPRHIQIPITIAYWTGMRLGEIIGARARREHPYEPGLSWNQVSFDHARRKVRLQLSGKTKNGKPRQASMPGDLYETLVAWREETKDSPCLSLCQHRGRTLKSINKQWVKTCVQLGFGTGTWNPERGVYEEYDGLIFHDFRRTGLSNLITAGVDPDTAMSISGHLTMSVFTRYNIVDERRIEEAGEKVVADILARSGGQRLAEVVSIGGGR